MKTMQVAVLLAACLALASAAPSALRMHDSPADMGTMTALPPFSKLLVNVPFNVLVMPGNCSLKVDADKSVADALQTNVTDGTLYLTTNASFTTYKPIKVTIMLPANNLTSAVVAGSYNLVVQSGFTATNFSGVAQDAALLAVANMTASRCFVSARGTSQAVVNGSCQTADVTTSGVSTAFVGTVQKNATTTAAGNSAIALLNASPNVNITAALEDVSFVTFNQGQCRGDGSFLTSCSQGNVSAPQQNYYWTCGIQVNSTSSAGFYYYDGAVVEVEGNKQVKDNSGLILIQSVRCDASALAPAAAPGAAPAMAPSTAAAAAPAPSMPMST